MVEPLTPFHSLSSMPQTLEDVTLSAIKMLHEKVNNTGLSIRKLFPISKPKTENTTAHQPTRRIVDY